MTLAGPPDPPNPVVPTLSLQPCRSSPPQSDVEGLNEDVAGVWKGPTSEAPGAGVGWEAHVPLPLLLCRRPEPGNRLSGRPRAATARLCRGTTAPGGTAQPGCSRCRACLRCSHFVLHLDRSAACADGLDSTRWPILFFLPLLPRLARAPTAFEVPPESGGIPACAPGTHGLRLAISDAFPSSGRGITMNPVERHAGAANH
jgi:hypothetical protein